MTEATVEASFPVEGDLDLVRTCRPLSSGPSDPTWWFGRDRVARSRHTGSGPATVEVRRTPDGVAARAWGPGAEVALAEVPAMVGAADRADGFRPDLHPLVGRMARRRVGLRFGAGGSTWDAALPTVLGQRVTTREAHRSWWQLVRRHGAPRPGTARPRPGTDASPGRRPGGGGLARPGRGAAAGRRGGTDRRGPAGHRPGRTGRT